MYSSVSVVQMSVRVHFHGRQSNADYPQCLAKTGGHMQMSMRNTDTAAHSDTYAQRYDVIIPGRIKMQFSMRNAKCEIYCFK